MKKSNYVPFILSFVVFAAFTTGFFLSRTSQTPIVQITRTTPPPAVAVTSYDNAIFPLDINTANQMQLTSLPGIGEVTAEKIVAYRTENGVFHDTSELLCIDGIGQKKLDKILPYIIIGGSSDENTGS